MQSTILKTVNNKQQEYLNERYMKTPVIEDSKLLALLNISEECKSLVRVFDENDGLKLVHYLDESDPRVHHVRGIVVANVDGNYKIVCRSFPYTPEITLDENSEPMIRELCSQKGVIGQDAPEGTLIRAFNHNGKWFLSTHKKIDGRKSRWNSPPFGEMFDDIIGGVDNIERDLNPEICYVFLMCHPNHVLIRENKQPRLYCVAAYLVNENMRELKRENVEEVCEGGGCGIFLSSDPYLFELENGNIRVPHAVPIKNCDNFLEAVREDRSLSGFLIKTLDGKVYKIVSPQYERLRVLRGNEPNPLYRFVDLYRRAVFLEEQFTDVDDFTVLFPAFAEQFHECGKKINHGMLDGMYLHFQTRFVNGLYAVFSQVEFLLLQKIAKAHPKVIDTRIDIATRRMLTEAIKREVLALSPKQMYELVESRKSKTQ